MTSSIRRREQRIFRRLLHVPFALTLVAADPQRLGTLLVRDPERLSVHVLANRAAHERRAAHQLIHRSGDSPCNRTAYGCNLNQEDPERFGENPGGKLRQLGIKCQGKHARQMA